MHNVEFKSELRDLPIAREVCRSLGATHIGTFTQVDTYFRIPAGRLKLRETQGEAPEYIFYERRNQAGPKLSHFTIYSQAQAEERFGREPLPTWLVVRKKRELYMLASTRIHLDSVEGLGTFLELESLISRDNSTEAAHATIADLRRAFGPVLGEPIDCGYSDLLAQDLSGGRPH